MPPALPGGPRGGRSTIRALGAPSLSIIAPAYDEERRIGSFVARVAAEGDDAAAAAGLELREVIVVDDGSTDATPGLLANVDSLGGRLRVVTLPRNRGKGAAVRAGMLAASGELALLTDVDLSVPLDDLAALAAAVEAGADVAVGSRALPGSRIAVRQPAYRELMGKAFNRVLRALTGLPVRDTQCGFKLFRLDAAKAVFARQRVNGFAYDAEVCLLARQLGLELVEVPVRWSNDPQTHVHLVRSSIQMARDLVLVAWRARREQRRPGLPPP